MSRLNKATRDFIVAAALAKAGIPALEAKLLADRYDWANRMRVQANGVSDAELDALEAKQKALAAKIPEDLRCGYSLAQKRTNCWPNLGGLRVGCIEFSENSVPAYSIYSPTFTADAPIVAEFHALEDRARELADRRKVLTAQVKSVLESITTIKKLLEVWPEARELLPPNEQPVISNVPAVLIGSLNAAIGLPSEEEAA